MFWKQHENASGVKGATYRHVLKYTSLFGGVQGISMFLSIVRHKIVAVFLGSAGMGLIDIYNRSMSFLSSVTAFGIPFTAIKSLSEFYERGDEEGFRHRVLVVRSWAVLTALLGVLVCALCSPVLSYSYFEDYTHSLKFFMLSPMVGLLAMLGVEIAILKAVRRLRAFAASSLWGALSTLCITVPLYVLYGVDGIVPALLLSTLALTLITMGYTFPQFRWRVRPFSWKVLRQGIDMIRLSVAYTLAGVMASGAELFIRSFIARGGSEEMVGLYAAGFMLIVSYSGFVFVSMDADYFPRLSAIATDVPKMNVTINRQLEVSVLLIAPFLMFFAIFVPQVIHILYTEKFLDVVPMVLCGMFYMFFKAITTPIAYTSLARADSVMYFVMEAASYVFLVLCVAGGYTLGGLEGAGVGLSLSNLLELLMIASVFHLHYHFQLAPQALALCAKQGILLLCVLLLAGFAPPWWKYGLGIPLSCLAVVVSVRMLFTDPSLRFSFKEGFQKIIHRAIKQ